MRNNKINMYVKKIIKLEIYHFEFLNKGSLSFVKKSIYVIEVHSI